MITELESMLGTVHQGDCIAGMKELPSQSIHLAFADPPFNIGYRYDEYDDKLESEHYLHWSSQWIGEVYRVLDNAGAFWLAIGDEYAAELKIEAQKIGFHMRSWVVWYYTFGVHCRAKFTRSHAHLFHFVKDPKNFTFHFDAVAVPSARQLVYGDKRANPSGRMPDDTWILRPQDCADNFTPNEDSWYFPRVAGTFKERAGFHGCQMPEQLLGRIIKSCSNAGDVVLDPFGGSCTTLTVAKKEGRSFIGFELSKEYVKLGIERIKKANVGDALEGSPEPNASAPATFSSAARRGKNAPPDLIGFRNQPLLFSELEQQHDRLLEAFMDVHRGYSIDRVVADPILNEDFQNRCNRLRIDGTPVERNRHLFHLRKSGQLKQAGVTAEKPTAIDWIEIDPMLYAVEIAWRRMTELYADITLDELLCDPRLALQFDQLADIPNAGFTPLQYRWTALKLRDQIATARKKSVKHPIDPWKKNEATPLTTLDLEQLPAQPGIYIIEFSSHVLYAGETCNLRRRLSLQLSNPSRDAWPADRQTADRLRVSIRTIDTVDDARLARQCAMCIDLTPEWNFNDLFRAPAASDGK
ncbi:MAG: DNA methyltransferase [Pirellulaceae bacterium]